MNKDIAIIGVAGRFPAADDVYAFYQLLRDGVCGVREISKERYSDSTMPLTPKRPKLMGYLTQVDRFDHKFFNFSKREAELTDPHQRVMFEVAYEAFESSGYSPEAFSGSRTGVIVAHANYQYHLLIDYFDPTMTIGSEPFAISGRISRFLNLYGPTLAVDTGCSSSLMGVHMGVEQIQSGNADQMLIMGCRIILNPERRGTIFDVGVASEDGITRTFNADSTGSGSSEAIGALLLKSNDKAVEDGDDIWAVIRGAACNSNAQRAGSLTATSSTAQAEVIKEAWTRGGVDPTKISYVEAHGSGTRLGDPIEIGGLNLAFGDYTDRKQFVAVSSVKTNVGHSDKVAGMNGIIKLLISMRYKQLFANLHLTQPNPMIDFENSVAYIPTELKEWSVPEGQSRIAGVNSWGFAGNNVHVVLEEAPERKRNTAGKGPWLFTFSSRRLGGVKANMTALADFLEGHPNLPLEDMAYTLNVGRQHFNHRFALVTDDREALLKALKEDSVAEVQIDPAEIKLFCLFPDRQEISDEVLNRFRATPAFEKQYQACLNCPDAQENHVGFRSFAFQYSLYRMLEQQGLHQAELLGLGTGDLVVAAVLGESELSEAVKAAGAVEGPVEAIAAARLEGLVERETETDKVIFMEMGPAGAFTQGLRDLDYPDASDYFLQVWLEAGDGPEALLRDLYLGGYQPDWKSWAQQAEGKRTWLPGYQFDRIRCWLKPAHTDAEYDAWYAKLDTPEDLAAAEHDDFGDGLSGETSLANLELDSSWSESEQRVGRIWMELMKKTEIGLDDDFFTVGGHSLMGTMVVNRITKEMGIQLQVKDIFAFSTIRRLAESIDKIQSGEVPSSYQPISVAPKMDFYPLTHTQQRMWVLTELEEGEGLDYNLPVTYVLEGELNVERLEQAVKEIVSRHDIFRTRFVDVDGTPGAEVLEELEFDFRYEHHPGASPEAMQDAFIKPFDLKTAPLLRVALYEIGPERHLLMYDMHHIIFDGTSGNLFFTELIHLYLGGTLPKPALQYQDYAVWHHDFLKSETGREMERYWLNQFKGDLPQLQLPYDFPYPEVREVAGRRLVFEVRNGIPDRWEAFAQQEGVTLFMLLSAAYKALLFRYSGQEDVILGTAIAGRSHPDVEQMPGMFVNTLALRSNPAGEKSFRTYLGEVKDTCLSAYRYQDYPFDRLVDKLKVQRDPARNPIFDAILVLHNQGTLMLGEDTSVEGLKVGESVAEKIFAKFDITIDFLYQVDGLDFRIEYRSAVFKHETIHTMGSDLLKVLDAVIENPELKLGELPFELVAQRVEDKVEDFDFADF